MWATYYSFFGAYPKCNWMNQWRLVCQVMRYIYAMFEIHWPFCCSTMLVETRGRLTSVLFPVWKPSSSCDKKVPSFSCPKHTAQHLYMCSYAMSHDFFWNIIPDITSFLFSNTNIISLTCIKVIKQYHKFYFPGHNCLKVSTLFNKLIILHKLQDL